MKYYELVLWSRNRVESEGVDVNMDEFVWRQVRQRKARDLSTDSLSRELPRFTLFAFHCPRTVSTMLFNEYEEISDPSFSKF
jgi:hypothetical protein